MSEVGDLQSRPNLIHKVQEKFAAAKEKSAQARAQVKADKQAEKEADAKLGVAERLQKKIGKIETAEKKLPLGAQVETEWLKAYSRIYQALGEGKLKQAMEKISPLFTFHAKFARVGSGVVDLTLRVLSLQSMRTGLMATGGAMAAYQHGDSGSAGIYALQAEQSLSKAVFLNILNLEKVSAASAKAQGWAGEKVIKIANKILHKPEKPIAAPAPAA